MPHEKKVGELMIPLTDYPHIPYWFTIKQAIAIVKKTALGLEGKAEPTTLLVFDEKYQLMGSLTMEDLIRGIEKKFLRSNGLCPRNGTPRSFLRGCLPKASRKRPRSRSAKSCLRSKSRSAPDESIIKAIYLMMEKNFPFCR